MKQITYTTARAMGLSRYFTGRPCKYGHIVERYSNTGVCVECDSIRNASRYQKSKPLQPVTVTTRPKNIRDITHAKRSACATCTTPKSCRWCPVLVQVSFNAIRFERRA